MASSMSYQRVSKRALLQKATHMTVKRHRLAYRPARSIPRAELGRKTPCIGDRLPPPIASHCAILDRLEVTPGSLRQHLARALRRLLDQWRLSPVGDRSPSTTMNSNSRSLRFTAVFPPSTSQPRERPMNHPARAPAYRAPARNAGDTPGPTLRRCWYGQRASIPSLEEWGRQQGGVNHSDLKSA